ncbi:MAG TPA: TMEM43 family protein [Candidatus Dojkabacteria bacterium]|nr:TMEM43 family protein [Candidatus Dojkabacteria bacterium]HQF36353.1 TMEM43 family protein [Candidatus Dojkabacteria bacterium]
MSEEKRVSKTTEKVISSQVVPKPSKNILKNNPITNKIKELGGAIKAIPLGILLLLLGLYLTYASVIKVKEISKIVENSEEISAEDAKKDNELAFYSGKPELLASNSFEYKTCNKSYRCYEEDDYTTEEIENVIFLSATFERYEQKEQKKEETRTKVVDGEEIEETVEVTELVEDWEVKKELENWYGFSVGKIRVEDPKESMQYFEKDETTVENVYIPNLSTPYISRADASDKVGSTRLVITSYSLPDEINLFGEVKDSKINIDNTFIITDQDKPELVETLKSKEKGSRTFMRFLAWLALTIGFMTVLGPIMSIIEIIPFAGKIANFIALVIGAIISAIVVFVGVIIGKFWWLFVIIIIALIGGGIYLLINSRKPESDKIQSTS